MRQSRRSARPREARVTALAAAASGPMLPVMRVCAALWLCLAGCGATEPPRPTRAPAAPPPGVVRLTLDASDGLSGLTTDGEGVHWVVPERARHLYAIGPDGTRLHRLIGLPEEVDAEAITWLGGRRFAIGTESSVADRASDRIMIVEVLGQEARVVEDIEMPYAALGATPDDNDGIEGICLAGDELLVAIEHAYEENGERIAVLARRRLEGGPWSASRVRLTSPIGKLSALACRCARGGLEVLAIERGLRGLEWAGRVVRIPLGGPEPLQAELVTDLAPHLPDHPNPEGLTFEGDDLLIVVDNHYGSVSGPSELLRVAQAARPTAACPQGTERGTASAWP